MSRIGVLLVVLVLAGCAKRDREPRLIECSVDDTLVFVAPGVTGWDVSNNGLLTTYSPTDGRMYRKMQPNETCRAVSP